MSFADDPAHRRLPPSPSFSSSSSSTCRHGIRHHHRRKLRGWLSRTNGTDSTLWRRIRENRRDDGAATVVRLGGRRRGEGERLTENRKRRGRSATVFDKLVIRKLALFPAHKRARLDRDLNVNVVFSLSGSGDGSLRSSFTRTKCSHRERHIPSVCLLNSVAERISHLKNRNLLENIGQTFIIFDSFGRKALPE